LSLSRNLPEELLVLVLADQVAVIVEYDKQLLDKTLHIAKKSIVESV
jgi:hypothetical protein